METTSAQQRSVGPLTRLLLLFCRPVTAPDYAMSGVHYHAEEALSRLDTVFPGFRSQLKDQLVVDFGCGLGYQAVAFAEAGAARVTAVEIVEELVAGARKRVSDHNLEDRVAVLTTLPDETRADMIVSQNSFEHMLDAESLLAVLGRSLAPDGEIYLTFAPPWYAPYGAHMAFFCRLPWVQLLFPEKTVMEARSFFRSDGAKRYRDAGLAQMSVAKFERIVRNLGFHVAMKRYDCIRRMNFLQNIPILRELAINRISCILTSPSTSR